MSDSISSSLKPWLIASTVVLVGALVLLSVDVSVGFLTYGGQVKPLWLILLAVLSVVGIGVGFAGFFAMMMAAAWQSFRESRRVQVLPPDRPIKP